MSQNIYWKNGHPVFKDGKPYWCDTCPCDRCPAGSSLHKIKYAEKDTSCTPGAANEYRLNISCECKCLYPGEAGLGEDAADHFATYPIYGQTGEAPNIVYWKRSIVGGPFVDDVPLGKTAQEKCDAWPVEGCAGFTGCGWYKIRKAYWDANCPTGVGSYTLDSNGIPGADCECRCLIDSAVPDPLPGGRVAEDYTGFYGTVTGQYQYTLFGPYAATCDLSADQVCAAAHIEGCDYAWGCSWDDDADLPRFWWRTKSRYWYGVTNCSGEGMTEDGASYDRCCSSAPDNNGWNCVDPNAGMGKIGCNANEEGTMSWENWISSGPLMRQCDLT